MEAEIPEVIEEVIEEVVSDKPEEVVPVIPDFDGPYLEEILPPTAMEVVHIKNEIELNISEQKDAVALIPEIYIRPVTPAPICDIEFPDFIDVKHPEIKLSEDDRFYVIEDAVKWPED